MRFTLLTVSVRYCHPRQHVSLSLFGPPASHSYPPKTTRLALDVGCAACKKYTYPDTRFCWANATYASKPTDDSVFDGKLVCQHGPTECYDNVLEMCVIKYEPDWKKYTPWLQCERCLPRCPTLWENPAPNCIISAPKTEPGSTLCLIQCFVYAQATKAPWRAGPLRRQRP